MKSPEEMRYLSTVPFGRRVQQTVRGMFLNSRLPIFKETQKEPQNIGKYIERYIGLYADVTLPKRPAARAGNLAVFSTNERLPQTNRRRVSFAPNAPNGYLIGAGFGNIFHMAELFEGGIVPQAIITTDVMPEVVLAGRIIIHKLEKSRNFTDFWLQVHDIKQKDFTKVYREEKNEKVRTRLMEASDMARIHLRTLGGPREPARRTTRRNIMEIIQENFDMFAYLAQNGNIGITLADITNPFWISAVGQLPGFRQLRNLMYMSNTIDHVTNRGTIPSRVNDMNNLRLLGEGVERGNWFVDTTAYSLGYVLRVGNSVPSYDLQTDFSHRPIARDQGKYH